MDALHGLCKKQRFALTEGTKALLGLSSWAGGELPKRADQLRVSSDTSVEHVAELARRVADYRSKGLRDGSRTAFADLLGAAGVHRVRARAAESSAQEVAAAILPQTAARVLDRLMGLTRVSTSVYQGKFGEMASWILNRGEQSTTSGTTPPDSNSTPPLVSTEEMNHADQS